MSTHDTEQKLQRLAQIDTMLQRVDELAQAYGPELASLKGHVEAARIEIAAEIDRVHPPHEGVRPA